MLAAWADTFILHIADEENVMLNPDPILKCHHNVYQRDCKKLPKGVALCPTEDSVKYKMVRFSIESANIFLAEVECACNIQVCFKHYNTIVTLAKVFTRNGLNRLFAKFYP